MALLDIKIKGKEVKFDTFLKENCDNAIKLAKKNFDAVFIIDGMEGTGKTELARQCALYMDNDFNLDNLVFTDKQFYEAVENAKPGSVILWDEFVMAGLSTEALSKMQNALIKKFTTIRHKNLIIILVIPYIFMLRKYFALARARALIHVYSNKLHRGHFKFYDYAKKNMIYNFGHKYWFYSDKVPPSFLGYFKNWSLDFLDEEEYEKKKIESSETINDDEDNLGANERKYRSAFIVALRLLKGMGMTKVQVRKHTKEILSRTGVEQLWEIAEEQYENLNKRL